MFAGDNIKTENSNMNRLKFIILIVLSTALMGSAFSVIKMGDMYASPLMFAAIRFILAGLLLSFIVGFMRMPHPKHSSEWFYVALIGFFQTTGVFGAIFLSLRTITAGESSILIFVNPILVVLFSAFIGIRYRLLQWFGVIVGFIGVVILIGFHPYYQVGVWIALSGAVFWAITTLLVKRVASFINIWVLTAYQMLIGGILLFFISEIFGHPYVILNFSFVLIVLWLAIMSSIVQFGIWFYLIQKNNPGKVSSFLFLAPLFGVLSGLILLREPVTLQIIIGGFFILLGIFLVNSTESQRTILEKAEVETEGNP
jgi:drug/metabolite transporter (DMT)-like permease